MASSKSESGFSLVETIVAAGLLAGAVAVLGQMFAISMADTASARTGTFAAVLAAQKMEQLRGLTWGFDITGLPLTDTSSDVALPIQSATGGPGLSPSPPHSLTSNVAGYVDYVDQFGRVIGGGPAIPAQAIYVRRWSVEPLPTNPQHGDPAGPGHQVAQSRRRGQRPTILAPAARRSAPHDGEDQEVAVMSRACTTRMFPPRRKSAWGRALRGDSTRTSGTEDGFTLIELLVSTAIMMTVTAGVFTVMNPSGAIFQAQPETADVQQRLRVGVDTLKRDLVMAGGGAYSGSQSGPLTGFFAPVHPHKIGFLAAYDDPPETFRSDAISLFYVPSTAAQTTISASLPATSAELKVDTPPNCPPGDLCGFEEGMQVLLYDDTGSFDPMTVTGVQGSSGHLQRNRQGPLSKSYDTGAKVVQVQQHVYYLDTTTNQLMHYDGYLTAAPVVDNVVGLDFEYYGDPDPPMLRRPGIDRSTTYGPTPPALGVSQAPWPAGENCTMTMVAGQQRSRLPALGPPGSGLVRMAGASLTDGPWCPAADTPNRFDADLFRVRTIRVSLRVQSGNPDFRGSIGTGGDALFLKPGTSRGGYKQVPDQALRFDVTPRNLNLGR